MPTEYTAPVKNLLTYGDCSTADPRAEWPNYLELGFMREHIPELIRMATDPELHAASGESLEVWAPVHAWRTLAQLKAVEAVTPLLELYLANDDLDDDWADAEFPIVFEMIGPPAIPALAEALSAHASKALGCIGLLESLSGIAEAYPDARTECITILIEFLAQFEAHDPELNGFTIWNLMDVQAVEALPLIREAFDREYVDYSVVGDIEDVEIAMDVRTERATPEDRPNQRDRFPGLDEGLQELTGRAVKKLKVGRNDPCPCGSGKKYKKCCLNVPVDQPREEFLAMFSKQKIRITPSQKEVVFDLIRQKKEVEAVAFVQTLTSADSRLVADYVKRQEFLALKSQNRRR